MEDDYSKYKEPMQIYLADLFAEERERMAQLASKKMDERRAQMDKIMASGRRSLSGALAEALGMVPPLGKPLARGDHRKRIQALPEMEPRRARRGKARNTRTRKPSAVKLKPGAGPGPVLVHSSGKRGRGRPPGSKNHPKLPEGD